MDIIPTTEGVAHIGQRQRMSTIYRTNEIIRRIQGEGQSAEINAENTKKVLRLSSLYNCGVGMYTLLCCYVLYLLYLVLCMLDGVPKYKQKKTPVIPTYTRLILYFYYYYCY